MGNLRYSKTNCHWKDNLFSQIPREGGIPCHAGPHRKHCCQSGGRGSQANCGKSLYCGFLGEGMSEAGRAGLGLPDLENFSGCWGIGVVPSCLVHAPVVIRAGGQWSRVWEPNRRGGGCVSSGSVDLYLKSTPTPGGLSLGEVVIRKAGSQGKVTQAYYWVVPNKTCLVNAYRTDLKALSLQNLEIWSIHKAKSPLEPCHKRSGKCTCFFLKNF